MQGYVRGFIGLLVTLSAVTTFTAAPAEKPGDAPLLIAPSSSWNVDYADSECRLSRNFGQGADMLTFRAARGASFRGFEYVIAGKGLRNRTWLYLVKMRVDPGAIDAKLDGIWYNLPTGENAFRFVSEDAPVFDTATPDKQIVLTFENAPPIQLKAGRLGEALAALQACHDDLLASWGIDAAAVRALKAPAVPANYNFWAPLYAASPRFFRTGGGMTVKLDISPTGTISGCKVVASSKSEELDAMTCPAIVKRPKFKPALSSEGRPVAAPFVVRMLWEAR